MTYKDWFQEIKWLRDKIILPNNNRISKDSFNVDGKFNADSLNKFLFKKYNEEYPVNDGRRYKK
jgi:hypothetical protein